MVLEILGVTITWTLTIDTLQKQSMVIFLGMMTFIRSSIVFLPRMNIFCICIEKWLTKIFSFQFPFCFQVRVMDFWLFYFWRWSCQNSDMFRMLMMMICMISFFFWDNYIVPLMMWVGHRSRYIRLGPVYQISIDQIMVRM